MNRTVDWYGIWAACAHKDELVALTRRKAESYASAYRYLKAAECTESFFVFGTSHAEIILFKLAYTDYVDIYHIITFEITER